MSVNLFFIYTSKKVGEADNELYLIDSAKNVKHRISFGEANDKSIDEAIHEMSKFINTNYKNMNDQTIMSSHSITIKRNKEHVESKMNYRLNHQNLTVLNQYINKSSDA